MEEKIITKIIKNQDKILSNLKQKDIDKYCWIKRRFKKGGTSNDSEFQSRFKQFYRMNSAGLSNFQKRRFFELLENEESDIKYILKELYKIPTLKKTHSIQFFFTTKLLHTINNNKPIFDKMIGKVMDKNVEGKSKEEKIQSCVDIYKFLDKLYSALIKNSRIKKIIFKFRIKFNANRRVISDIKVLDFIIWSFGRLE